MTDSRFHTGFLLALFGLLLGGAAIPQAHLQKRHKATSSAAKSAAKTAQASYERDIAPLVKQYCGGCHAGSNPAAGLTLTAFTDTASVLKARSVWEKVAANVQSAHMPPPGVPHPTQAQRDLLVHWIAGRFAAGPGPESRDHVTLRRLNRAEYNNTIRDLLGVDFRPADDFPADDVGYGFDNIGEVLSLSPLLMEKYLAAAEKIAQAAIITPEAAARPIHFDAARMTVDGGGSQPLGSGILLSSEAAVTADVTFPKDGDYLLKANAYGQQAGPDPARMAFLLDKQALRTVDVTAVENAPQTYEARVHAAAGPHRIALAFTNDYYNPSDPNPNNRDRNLVINTLEVVAPPGLPQTLPAFQRRVLALHPTPTTRDACTRKVLAEFARRAYRRPVTPAEIDRLARCAQLAKAEGGSFERGLQLGIEAALVSPNFLFRVEVAPKAPRRGADRRLDSYELASRLSYFLWSSMPDEELFTRAQKGTLQDPKVLAAQVRRMLQDPKARGLSDNFAGQWLQLRNLANVAPDPARFPDFNDTLRAAMRTETEMFFQAIVHEDRSVLEFLDSNFTFLNEPLARHYGISGVTGDSFRRVTLTSDERGGLLTQASILTVTSNPTRTSPVKRGKWVLEQFLGTPPPPPLPGVGQLPDDKQGPLVGTLRQRMEQHRKNPICASCHARMDPLGFGLENFDAVGAWRKLDGGLPIDASGVLPGGQTFNGPAQLKKILLSKKAQFVHCLSEKLLIYALGRGLDPADARAVDAIAAKTAQQGYRFSALIIAIVQSDPFRLRRGQGGS